MGVEQEVSKVASEATATAGTLSAFWASYGKYVTHGAALVLGLIVGHKL